MNCRWMALENLAPMLGGWIVAAAANATPTPEAFPPPLGPGFQVDWAQVDETLGAPHSIADAVGLLDGTGPLVAIDRVTQFLTTINLNDASVPFAGVDPRFAVRVSGFVVLDPGVYVFEAQHDDGISLSLGGEEIIRFDADTPLVTSTSPAFTLTGGVYRFSAVSWEQGGEFDLVLRQVQAGRNPTFAAGLHEVPEPASALLVGVAVAALMRRRRND